MSVTDCFPQVGIFRNGVWPQKFPPITHKYQPKGVEALGPTLFNKYGKLYLLHPYGSSRQPAN